MLNSDFFCFFQRKQEWVGLKNHHPDLFDKAKEYEKTDVTSGKKYTWNQAGTLDEVLEKAETSRSSNKKTEKYKKLIDNFSDQEDSDDGCLICTL